MRSIKKSWLLTVIALASVFAVFFLWRNWIPKQMGNILQQAPEILAVKPQLGVTLGHSDSVNSVAFSPDGKTLASGSKDNTIKLWDVATGIELRNLINSNWVHLVVFSPDGKTLASASADNDIKLWDVGTGKETRTLTGHTGDVDSIAFSPDGKTLASSNSGIVATTKLWDVATGTEHCTLKVPNVFNDFSPVAFSPDGKVLASVEEKTIILWDITNILQSDPPRRYLKGHVGDVHSIAFSSDGKMLVSGGGNSIKVLFGGDGSDSTIKLWDIATGMEVRTLTGHTSSVDSVVFSPDNKMVASKSYDKTIKLWDVTTGSELHTFNKEEYGFNHSSIAFSPDGKTLASGAYNSLTSLLNSNIKLLHIPTRTFRTFTGQTSRVFSAAFSLDGKTLVINGGIIRLWDVTSGAESRTLEKLVGQFGGIPLSPDGRTLAKNKGGNSIELRDILTGTYVLKGNTDSIFSPDGKILDNISSMAFSPDGKTLASISSGKVIKLWDVSTGTELSTLKGNTESIRSVVLSSNGKTLASLGGSIIRLWDAVSGLEHRTLTGDTSRITSVTFSPDGKMLASGEYGNIIKLWDVSTGKEIKTIQGNDNKGAPVPSVTFSPDGKLLACGSYDPVIKLWDVNTGKELHSLEGHNRTVDSVFFHPDGKTLVSASEDNTAKLWDIRTGKLLASLVTFLDDGWVIVTPEGRFDTNKVDDIKGLHWLMPDAPLTPLPIEIFMRDYYEPKLLSRILAREKFKPVRDFSTLNRAQPGVKIVEIAPDSAETIQVTVEVKSVKSEAQKDTEGEPLESGVHDVRLFRDGQLVGYAPKDDGAGTSRSFWSWLTSAPKSDGEVELNAAGKATLKFSKIKWPRTGVGQVEFSVYAFNTDRIKSATDRKTYSLTPQPAPVKGRAYVISLGVNAYEREGLNLRYAANDARQVQEGGAGRLAALGEYEEVVGVPLVSDYGVTLADGRTVAAQDATLQEMREGQKSVTENTATKAHLRAALDALAGRQADAALLKDITNADKLRPARPEDLVIISVSSHGYTDSDGIFYIVPSDTGTAALSSSDFRSHCISSDELSRWLRDVDAGELVMIVDACHSAAAVEGTDFKPGPMGSRGLGQLSYDKGMRILTATQADNVALEANSVRQGLLIYALLQDGLGAWLADYKPRDKSVMLAEWLGYGVERVPRLYEEVKAGRMQISDAGTKANGAARIIRDTVDPHELDNDKTQQPSLFDFARRQREVVLAHQP